MTATKLIPEKDVLSAQEPKTTKTEVTDDILLKDIVWINVIAFLVLHTSAIYGIYLLIIGQSKLSTFVIGYVFLMFSGFGITAGVHRLWAHKCYKATWPLRILLMIAFTTAFQNSIYEWVRDHRLHHKFTDSNADPHCIKRGLFFAHIGWLMAKKHPAVRIKGNTIDMSDLKSDPIVMFQKKYYSKLMPLCCFVIPTIVPYYLTGESLWNSLFTCAILKYVISLHYTWLINSVAHVWGNRPYDQSITPANNKIVAILAQGEGWHNYHHAFPWDYKTSELGQYRYNISTGFIDFFAMLGWAYDLKTVSKEMIAKRAARTGDGSSNELGKIVSLPSNNNKTDEEPLLWGWDDQDMSAEDKFDAIVK